MSYRINLEIAQLLDVREEWVKAYFLDIIARYASKKSKNDITLDEEFMLEYARNKILEAHMLHMLEETAATRFGVHLRVIKGGIS